MPQHSSLMAMSASPCRVRPIASAEADRTQGGDEPSIAPRCVAPLDLHAACHAQSCASPPIGAVTRDRVQVRDPDRGRGGPTASSRRFSSLGIPSWGVMSPTCIHVSVLSKEGSKYIHLAPLRDRARRTSSHTYHQRGVSECSRQ